MKTLLKTASLLLSALLIAVVLTGCFASPEKAIVGTWVAIDDEEDILEFSNGTYSNGSIMATYRIGEENRLILTLGMLASETLEWDEQKAKERDEDYWYMSGKTLYFMRDTYRKQ